MWSDGTGVRSVPALDVEVFDSTGAGDAFAAGFLACLLDGSGGAAVDRQGPDGPRFDGVHVARALAAGAALGARAVGLVGGRP